MTDKVESATKGKISHFSRIWDQRHIFTQIKSINVLYRLNALRTIEVSLAGIEPVSQRDSVETWGRCYNQRVTSQLVSWVFGTSISLHHLWTHTLVHSYTLTTELTSQLIHWLFRTSTWLLQRMCVHIHMYLYTYTFTRVCTIISNVEPPVNRIVLVRTHPELSGRI